MLKVWNYFYKVRKIINVTKFIAILSKNNTQIQINVNLNNESIEIIGNTTISS